MKTIYSYNSDIGIKKDVNQDALLIKKAYSNKGEISLFAICDGMGGLSDGELASALIVRELNDWFESGLKELANKKIDDISVVDSINKRLLEMDDKIRIYGNKFGSCGTTISALFLMEGKYITINVGDSRVYKFSDNNIKQLTYDHSLVQKLLDDGKINKEEARNHPNQNILLQCIGAGEDIVVDYTFGDYKIGDLFLLCSDGFRHKLTEEEMLKVFNINEIKTKEDLKERVDYCVDLNKRRYEKDNISVICLKIKEGNI